MKSKLDLNSIVGFLLIGAIVLYFTVFFDNGDVTADAALANSTDSTQVEEAAIDSTVVEAVEPEMALSNDTAP